MQKSPNATVHSSEELHTESSCHLPVAQLAHLPFTSQASRLRQLLRLACQISTRVDVSARNYVPNEVCPLISTTLVWFPTSASVTVTRTGTTQARWILAASCVARLSGMASPPLRQPHSQGPTSRGCPNFGCNVFVLEPLPTFKIRGAQRLKTSRTCIAMHIPGNRCSRSQPSLAAKQQVDDQGESRAEPVCQE